MAIVTFFSYLYKYLLHSFILNNNYIITKSVYNNVGLIRTIILLLLLFYKNTINNKRYIFKQHALTVITMG